MLVDYFHMGINALIGNDQRGMEYHSISSSSLYLDKFYKNKMELKVILTKTKILIYYILVVF